MPGGALAIARLGPEMHADALGGIVGASFVISNRPPTPDRHALAAGGDFAIHRVQDAGHVPQIECPDRVARIAVRRIAGVDAPV